MFIVNTTSVIMNNDDYVDFILDKIVNNLFLLLWLFPAILMYAF